MSDIIESLRNDLQGLADVGAIPKTTMRRFNANHPAQVAKPMPMAPEDVKALRVKLKVSQPVLARYLNISPSTVKKWEHGDTTPNGSALKLLRLIAKQGLKAVS